MTLELPLWLQYLVVGVIVAAALWIFARKQLPGPLRRARVALAAPLVRDGRPAWMRSLAGAETALTAGWMALSRPERQPARAGSTKSALPRGMACLSLELL